MKLYLVRHGVSTGNTPGNLIGHSSHPLTPRGEAQAAAVAERLAPLGPMPVFSSDLPRALQTAEAIAGRWTPQGDASTGPVPAPVRPDPRLREIALGDFEGRSWDEFIEDTALGTALAADPYNTALPGGESLALLKQRVLAAVDDIVAATTAPAGVEGSALATGAAGDAADDRAAVLVAHDGPIRAILNHYLGVPPENWWTLSTNHGGLSLVQWTDGWVNVRFVNDTTHLAGLSVEEGVL